MLKTPPPSARLNTSFPTGLRVGFVAAALIMAATGWLSTLQTRIGADYPLHADPDGISRSYMDDSGEFVVAWSTWGVTHPPGYPLLGLIGNVWVRVGRLVGVASILSASMLSFVFAMAALVLVALILLRVDRYGLGATAAVLLAAFGFRTWLYASVAEVYAFGLALGMGLLYLALETTSHPTPGKVLLFGLLLGLAAGHHRTLVMLIPGLAFVLWPARHLGWRVWIGAAGLAVLSLVVYLYLPLTTLAGSPWIYGRSPATWEGFWDALSGREYAGGLVMLKSLPAMVSAVIERFGFLAEDMTVLPVIGGILGVMAGTGVPRFSQLAVETESVGLLARLDGAYERLSESQRTAVALAINVLVFLGVPISHYLVITTHLPVMVSGLHLALACGIGIAAISTRWLPAAVIGAVLAGVGSIAMFGANQNAITELTHNMRGQQIIDAIEAVDDAAPVVIETWGPRYSALAYGKYGSGELAHIRLIDSRSSLDNLPPGDEIAETLYTTQDFLYIAGHDAWTAYLGAPVALNSAGDGIVAVSGHHETAQSLPAGAGEIQIQSARAWIEADAVRITIIWYAAQQPGRDYSIFAHISENAQIDSQSDILAQGDQAHPVYGFYPFSLWVKGEIVRDDYRINVPSGSHPQIAIIGLYTIEGDGSFTNHLVQVVPIGR
jgi:hypothetical protein